MSPKFPANFGAASQVSRSTDLYQLQLAAAVNTCYTHVLDQPVPQFIFVGNCEGRRGGDGDEIIIAAYNDLIGAALEMHSAEKKSHAETHARR